MDRIWIWKHSYSDLSMFLKGFSELDSVQSVDLFCHLVLYILKRLKYTCDL
uniref:Uncharacterized protein n=1 Tax=Arundo donax TaxID=35708 RepID=A0A0A9BMC1_ARUDO